jgi:hypothetical protein
MKMKNKCIAAFVLAAWLPATAVKAQDFSSYSTQDLMQMRGQMTYMGEADRNAYMAERQSRMQAMSQEERMSFRADSSGSEPRKMSGAGNGQGSQSRKQLRDGSGGGSGSGRGAGGGH